MKRNYIIYIVISCIALLSSCQNNMLNAGASSLDQQDEIRVMADTFLLTSTLQECAAIRFTPDSFLLGECDTRFGTIKADILTQLACPLGNEYPYADQATVDALLARMYLNFRIMNCCICSKRIVGQHLQRSVPQNPSFQLTSNGDFKSRFELIIVGTPLQILLLRRL